MTVAERFCFCRGFLFYDSVAWIGYKVISGLQMAWMGLDPLVPRRATCSPLNTLSVAAKMLSEQKVSKGFAAAWVLRVVDTRTVQLHINKSENEGTQCQNHIVGGDKLLAKWSNNPLTLP